MKTVTVWIRSVVLGLCLLSASAFGGYFFTSVDSYGQTYDAGIIYNVPAGANYEWEVSGYANIILGGGGLSVLQYAGGGNYNDVGSTAYADDISYQLSASSGGSALFYLGW